MFTLSKRMLIAAALLLWIPLAGAAPKDSTHSTPTETKTTDNGCSQILDMAAARTSITEKLTTLADLRLATPCPVNVSMDATVKFVNDLLTKAFDDPYTYMLSPEDAADLDHDSSGQTADFPGGGIGVVAEWTHANGNTKTRVFNGHIFRIVSGSPAQKAGLKPSDMIFAVNGVSVIGKNFDHVLNLMRGKVGTPVDLYALSGHRLKQVHLVRRQIFSKPVFVKNMGGGIKSIVISSYGVFGVAKLVEQDIKATLATTKGYVVDERGNPGGWVDECVNASQLFIRSGGILTENERIVGNNANPQFDRIEYAVNDTTAIERTVAANGEEKSSKPSTRLPYLLNGRPVALLIDGNSASCSEIVAGALKDNYHPGPDGQGARLIGTRSFGKGIGQGYVDGPNKTKLRATSFQNLTPLNRWAGDAHKHRIGFDPDDVVENPPDAFPYSSEDRQARAAKTFLLGELHIQPIRKGKKSSRSRSVVPSAGGFSATTHMSLPSA